MVNGNLPDGWKWVRADDVCETIASGSTPKPEKMFNGQGQVPFIKVYNLTFNGALDFTVKPTFINSDTHSELLKRSRTYPNDVLMNIVGPPLGKISIVPTTYPEWNINQAIVVFRASPQLNYRFLAFSLMNPETQKRLQATAKATAGQFNLNVSTCRSLQLPIPPLPEQERIVAKIEELFTQLDAGTSALERVQAGLRRYKASVLKAAVEGKLLETRELETSGELPEGWLWTTVGEIAEHRLGKMLDKEKNKGTLTPYLRNINVRWFEFDFSDIQEMRVLDEELENISIQKGDLIVCEGGEPGRAAVWNREETMVIQKALHRVRTNENVLPSYLMYCLAADANNGKLEKYFTGSTIKHFTGQSLTVYRFPLPPLEEQRRIVAEIERRLSVAREVESAVEGALVRAGRLRQAVLRSAFEGRLV